MYTIVHALILVLSFVGFAIAFHIFEKKRVKKPLICPFRSNCDTVVTSNYSQIFGIPLERMGMAYYALVAVLHVVAFLADIHTPVFRLLLLVISGGCISNQASAAPRKFLASSRRVRSDDHSWMFFRRSIRRRNRSS